MPVFQFEVSRPVTIDQFGLLSIEADSKEQAVELIDAGNYNPSDVEWYDVQIPVMPENFRKRM